MEMTNSEDGNGGGVVNLPIGFRFHPTDEELVIHYLKRKVFSLPLPATVIPEFDVFQSSPWDLPGELKEKRYFFSKREMNLMKKCSNFMSSTADCGYWKDTNKDRKILGPGGISNFVIGIKKSYVFYLYQGKKSPHQYQHHRRPRGLKTQWVMHEFCLVGSINSFTHQVGDWVACRVYERKRKARNVVVVANGGDISSSQNLGFSIAQTSSYSSSSSCCSGITEISSTDLLDEEAISPPQY